MLSVLTINRNRNSFFSAAFLMLFILSGSSASLAINAVCGNGIAEAPEQCDDGNTQSGDGCSQLCTIEPKCGNRIAEPGEQCDFGTASNVGGPQGCNANCTLVIAPLCGNGVIDIGEFCDPAFTPNGCNLDCTFSGCRDLKLSTGEQCDGPGDVATCNSNCRFSNCEDSHLNTKSGEECDPGMLTASCNLNCRISRCGDNITNSLAGEECDPPGAMASGDTCSPACKVVLAATTAPGAGGLDTATIIGIAVGIASLLLAAIPVALVYRKYARKHHLWPFRLPNPGAGGAAGLGQKINPLAQHTPPAANVGPSVPASSSGPMQTPNKPLPQVPVNGGATI